MFMEVSSIDRTLEEIYANYVSYTSYYKDMEILDAKLDKALKIMVEILKETK